MQRDAPPNARDDIFNGSHTPRLPRTAGARNAVEVGMAQAECRRALQEFNDNLADFCRRLDIPPAWLNLNTPELLMLVCMRQQRVIDDLAAQVSSLAFPPVELDT